MNDTIKGVNPERLKELSAYFEENELEWMPKTTGYKNGNFYALLVPYMNRLAVMDRLDNVLGPQNWKDDYIKGPDGGVMCYLSIRVQGEWITKADAAENTDIESVKGGISDSLKRAAMKWGIGRYLAYLPKTWAIIDDRGKFSLKYKNTQTGRDEWHKYNIPPVPPEWLPSCEELKKQISNKTNNVILTKSQKAYIETELSGNLTIKKANEILNRLALLKDKQLSEKEKL